jgi:outer membrane protein assembly factor BamD
MIIDRLHRRFSARLACGAAALLALALLSACGNRDDAILEIGASQLYEQGAEALLAGNYAGAVNNFQNLAIRYPFSPEMRQAQLDLIYAYYRSSQPDAALDIATNFIRENPRLPEVAYCLYMTGIIYFDKAPNILERLFRVDVTERPPDESYQAFSAFQDLLREYPNSRYAADARQRMIYLRNRLATYENHVARYYLDRGAYVAAISRGTYAIEHFPGAPELEETLELMIEAYELLGKTDLAADTRRVLQESFGDSAAEDAAGA